MLKSLVILVALMGVACSQPPKQAGWLVSATSPSSVESAKTPAAEYDATGMWHVELSVARKNGVSAGEFDTFVQQGPGASTRDLSFMDPEGHAVHFSLFDGSHSRFVDYHVHAFAVGSPCNFFIKGGATLDTKNETIEGFFRVQDEECKDDELSFRMRKQ